jgi:signal transduction histidine kinase
MKCYCKKTKRTSEIFLFVSFICIAAFLVSSGFALAKDKAKIECDKETAVAVIHTAAIGLGEILKGLKSERQRVDLIRAFVTPIRFYSDNSGYFYVYDYKCVNIAHATEKNLEDKNLYKYRDAKKKYVIRELSATAKKGGGFVEYYWVKPGDKKEFKKIGYVEPIPGTNYFIETGVYMPQWTPGRPGSKR